MKREHWQMLFKFGIFVVMMHYVVNVIGAVLRHFPRWVEVVLSGPWFAVPVGAVIAGACIEVLNYLMPDRKGDE